MQSKILLRVLPPVVGVLAGSLWIFLTHTYAPHGDTVPSSALALWWKITFGYFGALFIIFSLGLSLLLYRKMDRSAFLASVSNLFTVCLIFALYFVTSDHLARRALADLGLNWLALWLLIIGIVLAVLFFYVFTTAVDEKTARPNREHVR